MVSFQTKPWDLEVWKQPLQDCHLSLKFHGKSELLPLMKVIL